MFLRCKKIYLIPISFFFVFSLLLVRNQSHLKHDTLNDQQNYDSQNSDSHNYLDDSIDHLNWFVQISDLHISIFHDQTRIKDFELFCKNILSLISPKLVLISGDLTDAKQNDLTGSRQFEQEWKTYHRLINESKVSKDLVWLDVRGNHDNFDVHDRNDDSNLYKKYGVMKHKERSYMHDLTTPNGDKYSFIAVDACVEPGPRRPFNFFGNLLNKDLDLLKSYADASVNSNGTIWFGHFPTSTIHSSINPRDLMRNGVAYLCGHLHTLGGLLPSMYTRHSNGLLELELADWKVSRMFRLMAFDAGLFSFRDFKMSNKESKNNIFVLITNPKSLQFKTKNNREPLHRVKYSTHIRFLVFSKHAVLSAKVFINDISVGKARQHNSSELFVLEWNPKLYSNGVHKINIVVQDSKNNIEIVSQEFSLDETITKSFSFLSNFVLTVDQTKFTKLSFYVSTCGILLILVFFRFNRRRFTVKYVSCGPVRTILLRYLRRYALLSSIDYIYWTLLLSTIYIAIGPWFIGEILEDHLGVCFIWGMLVKGAFLPADVQYMIGTFHMIFFQFLLMFHLSYQIEKRFVNMNKEESSIKITNCWKLITQNFTFIILVLHCLLNIYDFYRSYSFVSAVLCPFKTWLLLIAFYLRHKCSNLSLSDFNKFIDTSKFNSVNKTNEFVQMPSLKCLNKDTENSNDIKSN